MREPEKPNRRKRPNKPITLLITVVTLVAIYVGAAAYRIRVGENPEFYDPHNPTAFYWTENALQYHYAELVSRGEKIPALDPKLQAPDGVKLFDNLTILMEYPCGGLYRLLGGPARGVLFHTFTIYFMACFAGLTIFALYGCGRALGLSRPYSLLAAGLASFSYVAVGRSIEGFLNEDFSLPLFFLGLAFYLTALNRPRGAVMRALTAGSFFGLSLASWHFARFLFLGWAGCAAVNLWVFTPEPAARNRQAEILLWVIIPTLAVCLLTPVLRSRGFFMAPAFALVLGAGLGTRLFPNPDHRPAVATGRGWRQIAAALVMVAASLALSRGLRLEADYTHVWSLLLNKLRYFGRKPAEPRLLDYPARSLWIEAFNSPGPKTFLMEFFPLVAAAALGCAVWFNKRRREPGVRLVLLLSVLFFLGYLGIERLGVVAGFFVALLAGGLGLWEIKNRPRMSRTVTGLVLVAILGFNFYQGYQLHETTGYSRFLGRIFGPDPATIPNRRINNLDLIGFIQHRQPQTARFLARYSVGPMLLAYADQAIALQPKFEVRGSRERIAEYYRGIYGTEEDLYRLCRKWRMDYFLYDLRILLDRSRDSERWVADRLTIGKDCAAFLMHFAPERLRHFELIYQNVNYRLYRVLPPDTSPGVPRFPASAVYELEQYGGQKFDDRPFDDQWDMTVTPRIDRAYRLVMRGQNLLTIDPASTARLLEQAEALYPGLIGAATVRGTAYVLVGKVDAGLALCRQEVEAHPFFPLAHYNLAYALIQKESYDAARDELKLALELDPFFDPAREMLLTLESEDR